MHETWAPDTRRDKEAFQMRMDEDRRIWKVVVGEGGGRGGGAAVKLADVKPADQCAGSLTVRLSDAWKHRHWLIDWLCRLLT